MQEVIVEEVKHQLNVSGVLRILGISRSGYQSYKKRLPSERKLRKESIMARIKIIHEGSHQNYGAPEITQQLQEKGETVAEKTEGIYMREMGIRAQYVKPYTITTLDSDFSIELKNILNEEFNPKEPNAVWCSDITYIWTYEGFVYLTSIMDLYSRKIIA
ncbi:MAG: IS3 family transposase [Anaerocolumna sp.]